MIGKDGRALLHLLSHVLIVAGSLSLSRPTLADPTNNTSAPLLAPLPQFKLPDDVRIKAEHGDMESQRVLGDFYSIRAYAGSAGDGAEAVAWWHKAADQGDLASINKLSYVYALGQIVPRDAVQAMTWARKAADRDDPGAEMQLGSAYQLGFGVPKDKGQAIVWYRRAEAHGGWNANMARRAIAGLNEQDRPPTQAPADFGSLRRRAVAGNTDAQLRLGLIYADVTSALKDYQQADYWFDRAAQQGNAQAMSELSGAYSLGLGVPRDLSKALFWERKAASLGRIEDEIALSNAYSVGTLGVRDMAQSVAWLRKAAEQGSAQAQQMLALIYQWGLRGLPKDDSISLFWLTKSANQHFCPAEQMLAIRYDFGAGVPRDDVKARAWFAKAADHPHDDFCQNASENMLQTFDRRVTMPH